MPDVIIELVRFCKDKGFCIEVGTSLNGVGEAHDLSRGRPGNFHNVDYLIRELKKLGVDCAVGFVLSKDTADNLHGLRTYLRGEFGLEPLVQWYNEAPFYSNKKDDLDADRALAEL
jgi:sulfatase maturation enzyme AslB (radical SAM superfamily)